jgi:hypothetical protein
METFFNKYKHLVYAVILLIGLALYLSMTRYEYEREGRVRIDKWKGERQVWSGERDRYITR